MTNHSAHSHPSTPAARAACRKEMAQAVVVELDPAFDIAEEIAESADDEDITAPASQLYCPTCYNTDNLYQITTDDEGNTQCGECMTIFES